MVSVAKIIKAVSYAGVKIAACSVLHVQVVRWTKFNDGHIFYIYFLHIFQLSLYVETLIYVDRYLRT